MAQTTQNATSKVSFAKMVQQEIVPTREQAIVFDSIEGHTVEEYTIALAKIVTPKDIHFVSRISHGRICFYLSSKDLVDRLVDKNTKINIGNKLLGVRPLITKTKRIIISNVQPCVPCSVIESELKKLDIVPVSPITTMRAGIYLPEMSHILSFRKQMYIKPDDFPKIPNNMQITHENVNYWIYLSAEKLTCFHCKEEGHLAKYCKNAENISTQQSSESPDTRVKENVLLNQNSSSEIADGHLEEDVYPSLPYTRNKRPLSSSASTASKQTAFTVTLDKTGKYENNSKKKKTEFQLDNKINFVKLLEPAKEYLSSNVNKHPISYDKFLEFLEITYGKSKDNIMKIALTYTNDREALHNMLTDTYGYIDDRSLKSRITRIKKILINPEDSSIDNPSEESFLSGEHSN